MLPVEQPFKTYTGKDGKPLGNGYVYIGQPNQNPITAPVTVYWDAAGTIPAAQPLRTDNGYIVRAGSPANVFFDGAYSELVQDSHRRQVAYSKTSDEFSLASIVGGFMSKLAVAIGSSLIGYANGGTKITVEQALDLLYFGSANVCNPRYAGGADATGNTFSTKAFKAAFAASRFVHIPAGTFKIDDTVSKVTTDAMRVSGAGVGVTFVQMWTDKDLFNISNAGGSQPFSIDNMTLQPRTNMQAGAAINARNDTALPSLRVTDVFIGSSSTYEFKYGIRTTNCTEAIFERVVMYGLGISNFIGWEIGATMAATVPKWFGCSVYNARYGVHIVNSSAPGIEGVQFYGCDLTAVSTGVFFENTYGTGYFPPQMTWVGGHINATNKNFDLNIISQATITGGLFYNSGPGPMMNINTCSDLHICDNKFVNVGSGTPAAMDIYSGTGPINLGVISRNYFSLHPSSVCINFAGDQPIYNGVISENLRAAGAKTFAVVRGVKDPSIRMYDNTPDQEDLYDTVTLVGSTLSVVGKRADFLTVSGSGTVTTMPGGYPGDTMTLKCDGGVTLQHNGIAGGGFLLKGATNFTFTAGSLITLALKNGGYWTEISRSV